MKIEADSNDITEHPHDDKPRPYLCTVCDKRFTRKDSLNDHKLTHTREKLYSCTQCDKHFTSQRCLRSHMNVHSSKYQCTECGKCFKCSDALTVHRRIHSGEKPFECTVCSKRFMTASNLVKHSRFHGGDKPYKYHMCDKAFSESENLSNHMRVHMGEKRYKCSVCKINFTTLSWLQAHVSNVHSNRRPYVSHSTEVKTEADTNDISEGLHDDKPTICMFQCTVCSKRFATLANLVQHSRFHSGEKPFKCQLCAKAFSRSDHLNTHMRVHTGDKPYKCSVCKKSFTTSSNLKKHERNVHSSSRPCDDRSIEVNTEADSNDITECSHDDKSISGMFGLHLFICVRYFTFFQFLAARRYASAGLCDSDVSVRPSVCHTPVLCLAERKQDREMYTI